MENREKLGSRLGFILLSAGCAIGCGNVWKFPWMAGKYGGAAFVLVYLICLLILGLPVMVCEFTLGRASQKSPIGMLGSLEPKGTKWHVYSPFAFLGNLLLMMFYTVVSGWMVYFFVNFLIGNTDPAILNFGNTITNPGVNVGYMGIVVVLGFFVLCFNLQGGLEKVTKVLMSLLFVLMIFLGIRSCCIEGAGAGIRFYLVPDFSKINGVVIVNAMNQAFFTLSLGIGSMAIFGSYIGKERSLLGESVNVIALDTLAALLAGLIIFPSCSSLGLDLTNLGAGPGLLFNTMAGVFDQMKGGRFWGTLFFLFMVFAAFSTVLAVFENILAMVREKTGWNRPKACIICGIAIFLLSIPCALGYSTWGGFHPFASDSAFLDLWDFCVSYCLLPIGSLVFILFCCWGTGKKFGWGWENLKKEANTGKGLKVQDWMKPIFKFITPVIIIIVFAYGMVTFPWKDAPAAEPAEEEIAETVEEAAEETPEEAAAEEAPAEEAAAEEAPAEEAAAE